jgi:hypothetical protein
VKQLAFIFRDRRDQLYSHWLGLLKDRVGDEYLEVLESPIGARLVKLVVEELVVVAQAEAYELPQALRRVELSASEEAARRARLGFELNDVLAGLQLIRSAMWRVLGDALAVGDLPAAGETMDEMCEVDEFLDRLVRAEVRGYLVAADEQAGGE